MNRKIALAQKKQPVKSFIKITSNIKTTKEPENNKLNKKKILKQNQCTLRKKNETLGKRGSIPSKKQEQQMRFQGEGPMNQIISIKPLEVKNKQMEQLFPCKECVRLFVQTSLQRHQKICKKIFTNKRKVFNSAKQRIISKEQIKIQKQSIGIKPHKIKLPVWKEQSMAFRLALKQARGGVKTSQQLEFLAKEKKKLKESMFKCKGCGRNFNEESGKRHEVHCLIKNKDFGYKGKRK